MEDWLLTSEWEEPSTSGVNNENFVTSTSIKNITHRGKIISIVNNKYHIICFEHGEKEHYKSKYPQLMKKKAPIMAPKPKEVGSLIQKDKEHILCFSCKQWGHYRSQCLSERNPTKDKRRSSNLGEASKIKPKVSLFNKKFWFIIRSILDLNIMISMPIIMKTSTLIDLIGPKQW